MMADSTTVNWHLPAAFFSPLFLSERLVTSGRRIKLLLEHPEELLSGDFTAEGEGDSGGAAEASDGSPAEPHHQEGCAERGREEAGGGAGPASQAAGAGGADGAPPLPHSSQVCSAHSFVYPDVL